jgi:hypothetical protein
MANEKPTSEELRRDAEMLGKAAAKLKVQALDLIERAVELEQEVTRLKRCTTPKGGK